MMDCRVMIQCSDSLAATVPSIDWGQLNSVLYTVTFMAQQNGRGRTCQYCLETDHQSTECVLAPKKLAGQPAMQGGVGLPMGTGAETRKPWSTSGGWPTGGMGSEP